MSDTAIRERGETPFPQAGEGVVLRFRNSDLKRIEAHLGGRWFLETVDEALTGNMTVEKLEFLIKHGAKNEGQPVELTEEALDDVPVFDLGEIVMDAVCLSMRGKSFKEHVEESFKAFREAEANGELPSSESPERHTSMNSEERQPGPESDLTNSGTTAPAK